MADGHANELCEVSTQRPLEEGLVLGPSHQPSAAGVGHLQVVGPVPEGEGGKGDRRAGQRAQEPWAVSLT